MRDVLLPAVLYPVLGAVVYSLGAWAVLTYPLWSRYPPKVLEWARCPACSGTWYTAGIALLFGEVGGWRCFGLPGRGWWGVGTAVLAGLWGYYLVPLLAAIHLRALAYVGSITPAISDEAQTGR